LKHSIGIATLDYWRRVEKMSTKLVEAQPQPGEGFALVANGRRMESSWKFAPANLRRLIHVAEV
jgi:hypothetical protein